MIYRGQFSDYNNNIYTLDFIKHDGQTSYVEAATDVFNAKNQHFTFTEDRTDERSVPNDGIYFWDEWTVPRNLPSGHIYFVISTIYFDGINIGDELEFQFTANMGIGWDTQRFKHVYGVRFGKITRETKDGKSVYSVPDTDGIKVNLTEKTTYTYTTTITESYNLFGFVLDRPQCNALRFRDMSIINKTQGTVIDLINATDGWHIKDYYERVPDTYKTAFNKLTFSYASDYSQGWTTPDGQSATITCGQSNDGSFGDGYLEYVYTYSNWDTNWDIRSLEQGNDVFRYPNMEFRQNVYLPSGEYRLFLNYCQYNGGGLMFKFKKDGNTISKYDVPQANGGTNLYIEVTLDEDCDELFFGNEDESLFSNNIALYEFKIEKKTDAGEVHEITLGGTPFVVELEGDEDDIFKPIRTSTAAANIVTDEYLFDLYSNTNDINVTLYDNNMNIKWLGIVKPLIFNMGYNQKVEEIEVECIDYLEMLDSLYLSDTEIISNRPLLTFGEIFARILSEKTKYKYLYYPEIFNFNMLDRYSVSSGNFIDKECKISGTDLLYTEKNWTLKKILEEMCKFMGVTLVADGENLMLLPYLHLQYLPTYKKYLIGSKLVLQEEKVSNTSSIPVEYMYENSDLELMPVLNKFTCTTKTNKIEDLIPDFLNEDNLVNITGGDDAQYNSYEHAEDITIDKKKYSGDFKFYRCTANNMTNYVYTQRTEPTSQSDYSTANIDRFDNVYPQSISDLEKYSGGIIAFKSKDITEEEERSEFKSSEQSDYQTYYVISKGKDINLHCMAMGNPVLKLESDVIHFTNKMALKISGSMIQAMYARGKNRSEKIEKFFDRWPIERDDEHYIISNTDKQNWLQTDMFCHLNMVIKVGDYYFRNCGSYFKDNQLQSIKQYFRKGWWDTESGYGVVSTRLQFDNEDNKWAFGNTMSVTDNSGDDGINQDSAGYWIMFNANESQGDYKADNQFAPRPHVDLPEQFTGRLEIYIFPNCSQAMAGDDRYFGGLIQFLSDFEVSLVVPRDMNMTEEEWNSETEISAIIDNTSFQNGKEITCELHTDFGKTPAYSTVIGASEYSINNVDEETHCAEEWIVYNYTKQYSEIRKILNTSLKESNNEIRPCSIIEMKNTDNFTKMMIDSYKKDYRTGYTEVKLVEICDL